MNKAGDGKNFRLCSCPLLPFVCTIYPNQYCINNMAKNSEWSVITIDINVKKRFWIFHETSSKNGICLAMLFTRREGRSIRTGTG